ncbi:MAG: hypothetical protein JSU81_00120 [Candidatus Coatesbacteria bacterium]|nr:MAG: hypothetical protein JSU81_00120 [Candidatus Coatesbacteria bacterium]
MSNLLKIISVFVTAAGSVACFAWGWIWPGVGLAVIAVALFTWTALTFQRRFLKVKSAEVTLRLLDAGGSVAHFEKRQELVPLGRPLADIRDRNLFTRGRLDDFEVEPGEIGERMSIGKYYIIKVVFKPPLAPGVPVARRLAYKLYDAFPGEDVSFMFVGDYLTDDVVFRVYFPPDRLPHRAGAHVKIEGRPPKAGDVELSPDKGLLTWHLGRMQPGAQYHVEWSW